MATRQQDTKFRGMWSPSVGSPSGYAFKFLPTAPAQKPKTKANAPPPNPVIEDVGELLVDAPREASQSDRYNNYRGYISPEGTCYNNRNQIIGYIDEASGQVGSTAEEYLGYIRQDNVIENAAEEKLGELDMGRATIQSGKGIFLAEIDGTGSLKGHTGSYLGQFEPFGYRNMKVISLYLLLVDPGMLNEVEG